MFGRATIRLGIGPHSSFCNAVRFSHFLFHFRVKKIRKFWWNEELRSLKVASVESNQM